jgi:hypothetical protein
MPLRLLFFLLVLAGCSFACNRHSRSSVADPFNDIVKGDTVAFYPTMIAQLRQDSIERQEAYYFRINKVKRVEITDGDSREVSEIDRFGHELTEECYIDGSLFWRNVDVYNRYGHISSDRHAFYNDGPGKEDLVFESKYKYEPDGWTLGERLVSIEMKSRDYDDDEQTDYGYYYYYAGHLLDSEVRFENKKCTEKVFYSYDEFDKPIREVTINFEEQVPDTTIRTYIYDSQRREINWSVTNHGILLSDHPTEYNTDGRMSKYSTITYDPYSSWVFEYFYLTNGLISHRVLTHGGESETERYAYAYYP